MRFLFDVMFVLILSPDYSRITQIPVVFMIVADPVGAGIIQTYESSGRTNITGTRNRVPEKVLRYAEVVHGKSQQ